VSFNIEINAIFFNVITNYHHEGGGFSCRLWLYRFRVRFEVIFRFRVSFMIRFRLNDN
jgi:hypothetical protein